MRSCIIAFVTLGYSSILLLLLSSSLQAKKPIAQTAHLVFADTKANASKNQKSRFLPTHEIE
ncbi:hypothetical protein C1N53_01315 [Pontibacter sp. SGAir0037]|nr:hypothetical protein C1N53_01315 [Pontibacter sp. SGAir0037]